MPDKKSRKDQKSLGLELGNVPPQALEVEESVLGAMLLEASCVDMAMEELTVSSFCAPRHKMIFEAISKLVLEHTPVDMVTVSAKLKSLGNLEDVGGIVALANLTEKVGAAAHIESYVAILKQKAIQRDLISASIKILKDAYDDSV
ncbi:MAG: replicative DNA helicase, partial [Bacteroidales bacterium]|nr:replicative DNA helicase [Bacteroidales bacterium]